MKLTSSSAASSALAVVFLVAGAAPGAAQGTPLGSGGGTFIETTNQEVHHFSFYCEQRPNGSITGKVLIVEPVSQAFLQVDVTSAMPLGDMLAVAGEITAAVNTPPQFSLGQTMFLVFDDNGNGGPVPDQLAIGIVPVAFGNPPIQVIIAIVGAPPPSEFRPLLGGDIKIFS